MDLKADLQQLFERYETDIGEYAWKYETDRWAELAFCLLNQCGPRRPENTRICVALLQGLGLLEVENLAQLDRNPDGCLPVLRYVLEHQGFSADEASRAVSILVQAANAVRNNYGGKIQRYLRSNGERMRDELATMFAAVPLNSVDIRYAVSQWLQNALSLPISLENQAMVDYCSAHKVTQAELLRAADELDLNLALLDDVLDVSRMAGKPAAEQEAEPKVIE